MKKSTIILGLLAVMFSLAGCSYHEASEPCKFHKKTIDLVVYSSQWQFDDQTGQYYASFDIPEITDAVYNYGEVSVSREFNSGTKDAHQVVLPMSSYMVDNLEDGGVAYYTRHIDYRLGIGYIDIQLTNSDYLYAQEKPEDMLFRVQLTY